MLLPTKKGKKLSAIAYLQQDINSGCTSEEAYIPPKNLINTNTHTTKEKTRLL